MTDRLSLTNAVADANIERRKAERIATEILDAIHDNVATKQDLQTLRMEIKADLAQSEHRLLAHRIRALVVLAGLLLAASRYLPHS